MAIKNIEGIRYNMLVAVSFSHSHQKNAYWVFKCDCGNKTVQAAHSVKRGDAKSCGCHRKMVSSTMNLKHGKTKTRLYRIWSQMKRRCDLPTVKAYPRYGGRGIKVCKEWSESFEVFEAWALANGYEEYLTIDRENNDGNYEPGNCRWVDKEEQANNRSSNRLVFYRGEFLTLSRLAKRHGIDADTLAYRIDNGWLVEDAVSKPIGKQNKRGG